jgi:hypothetical protein
MAWSLLDAFVQRYTMNTMNQDTIAETEDHRSNLNVLLGPDTQQVEARQSSSGHDKRAGEITLAMRELPDINHKTQLRSRVEARLGEMAAALIQLGGDAAHQKWARDIKAAMQAAQSSMSGGWDRVGETEAAQLAHWLEITQNIGVIPVLPEGSH